MKTINQKFFLKGVLQINNFSTFKADLPHFKEKLADFSDKEQFIQ